MTAAEAAKAAEETKAADAAKAEEEAKAADEAKAEEAKSSESTRAPRGGQTYQVTAPLIAVPIGAQVLQYSAGDILPNGISKDAIKHLSDLGFIAKV